MINWLMPYHIIKNCPSSEMWLKSLNPVVTWGPKEQARKFQSKAEAATVARELVDRRYVEVAPADDLPL